MKILITGGAGFIGSNLALALQERIKGGSIYLLDRFRAPGSFTFGDYRNLIEFRGEAVTADIACKEEMKALESIGFDYIFHQAALSDTRLENQELVCRSNIEGFRNILELARTTGAKLIYASSAAVYGGTPAPNTEGVGEAPLNVYGFSKLMCDRIALKAIERERLEIVGLRYFNAYGRGEYFKSKMASMVLQLALQIHSHKKVRLFKHGEQKRDFVYIDDIIEANLLAMEEGRVGVYNIGSGEARSFNALLDILTAHLGEFEREYIDNPYSFYQEHTEADLTHSRELLGYAPKFSLEEGVGAYMQDIAELHGAIESGMLERNYAL